MNSLRRRLIVAFVVLIALPTAVISVYSLQRSSEILIDKARQEGLRGAGVRAAAAARLLDDIGSDLQYIAQAPVLRRQLNTPPGPEQASATREVERFFVSFLARWSERYNRLCLLDSRGRELSCVRVDEGRRRPAIVPPSQLGERSAEPYFAGAMQLRAIPGQQPIYISEVELDAPAGVPVLRHAVALQSDRGTLEGVLVLQALVAPILGTLQAGSDGTMTSYVVDRQGNYLLHPQPARRFAHLRDEHAATLSSERPRDAALILGEAAGTLYASADRPQALQVFTRIRPPGQSSISWTLIDEQSLSAMLVDVRHTRTVILTVAALGLLAAVAIALLVTRSIVGPIDALARAADAIRHGELDTPLPVASRDDEVGVLTHAFAQMAQRVRELVGTLQQRVAELERSDAALRLGQARLRQMMDANLAGIVFFDLDGRAIEANDAYLRIVGYDRDDLRAGRIHRDQMTPPEYREVTEKALAETRERGACTPYEKEYVRKDGSRVPVLIGIARVEPGSGQAVAFVLDQTALHQAAADRAARLAAEAASRAKSDFLARMSHELRTPLNAILGFAQILRRESGLTPHAHTGLAAIQSSGEHLLQLIVDLLDLSRVEAGRFTLDARPTPLAAVLDGVQAIIRVRAQQKALSFVVEIAGALPRVVQVDELRLRQVLLNLLGNAVKFTDHGEVRLRVSASDDDAAQATVRFEVSDTGVGIAANELPRLFQPFEQVGERERRAAGTGLGLAISQQIVQLMGSSIQVESRPGAGTRFWFELSLPVLEAAAGEAQGLAALPSGYAGARRRILVADDDALSRLMMVELLRERGFEITEAKDGAQALTMAVTRPPDLLLIDANMPVLDGLQTMQRLRRRPALAHMKVICVSASAADSTQRGARAAGADAFITKPVDIDRLLAAIGAQLGLQWTTAAGAASAALQR
jgi:PAS domain S-box-containing protein